MSKQVGISCKTGCFLSALFWFFNLTDFNFFCSGTIQMLQQAKERLEMNSERTRQQHSKELDSKEEEIEEMRVSYQKKVKTSL